MRNLDEYIQNAKETIEALLATGEEDIRSIADIVSISNVIETDHSLSSEELSVLSKHDDWRVRYGVASHKNTSAETLAELAKDEHEYVRENVAYNDNTPPETLSALKNDKNVGVRYMATATINESKGKLITINDPDKVVATDLDVARAPETTAEVLDRIATLNIALGSKNIAICEAIAQHKNASAPTLEMLSKHERWEVRLATTSHPKLPLKALKLLTKDKDINVSEAAVANLTLRNRKSLWGRVKKIAKGAKKAATFIGTLFSLQGKVPVVVGDVTNIANKLIEAARKEVRRWKESKDLSTRKEWTPELAAKAVKKNGNNLKYVPEKYATKEICLLAVANKGEALQFAPKNVVDKDICDKAMECNPKAAFVAVPDSLKTPAMCDKAITADANNLKHVPEKDKDEVLCIKAINMCGKTLDFVPQDLRNYDMCALAVKSDGESLKFVPEVLRTKDLCKLAKLNTQSDVSEYVPTPKKAECSPIMKQIFEQTRVEKPQIGQTQTQQIKV